MDQTTTIGIFFSLAFSFFFSGIEIAFLSSNKLQIELKSQQGSMNGKIMSYFMKKPSWFIGTTLIGNTVALVFFGNFMAQLIVPVLTEYLPHYLNNEPSIMLIQTFLATMLILFSAEFLPKSLFMINPNIMFSALAIPFAIAFIILFPLMIFIVSLSKFVIIYILRFEYSEEKPVFALTDLNNYLKGMHKVRHEDEDIELDKKIFHNALEFKSVRVRECMIPRTEIIAVEADENIQALRDAFIESGHSKIIIYKETIDDVIGYSHSSALFKKPGKIEEILTPIIIVPETTLANELMIRFINQRKSLAVVVDEFGGTSGIVSMEDVIEEIFGEIEDEHDEDDLTEQKLEEHTYLLSARLEIDYLNDTYGWNLPIGDYETLSGLILSYTEDIPQPGESVVIDRYTFTVQSTLDNRIDTIKITVNPKTDQAER
jgi:CBS domain containing-hemolysin-like protein